MAYTEENLKSDIRKVTRLLQQTSPFFFVLPFKVITDQQWADMRFPPQTPTAAATQKGFFFAETFMENLPENKRLGLLLHEVFHPALGHLSNPWVDTTLAPGSFRLLRNIAQDAVIESSIYRLSATLSPDPANSSKPHPDPTQRIICQQWPDENCLKYGEKSWREVYDEMKNNAKHQQQGQGNGNPGEDGVDHHDGFGEGQEDKDTQAQWKNAVEESQQIVKRLRSTGKSDAFTIEVEMVEPELPWTAIMREHMQQIPAKVSKTWFRVKRRPFALRGEYVPRETGTIDALNTVVFFVDTSGSMNQDLDKCASEISSLLWQLNCKKLILVEYDTKVCNMSEMDIDFECPEQILTHLHGGGGTSIRATLQELIEEEKMPSAEFPMIVLTDGGDDYNVADLMKDHNITWITYGSDIKTDSGRVISAKV